jgi:uncharacterized membrane protein YbaN (DUF454 family)
LASGALLKSKTARGVCLALGWVCVGLAVAGVFLPGLPVTIFVIIASYLFARSSPRFHDWLWNHRWFGPRLRRFQETGGMPWRAKRAALFSMWTAVSISALLLMRVNRVAAYAALGLAVVGTLTIVFWVRTVPE